MIEANCHCGAVKIFLKQLPVSYTECNCSICRRYAAQWLYVEASEVEITAAEGVIARYQWGDHEIDFCHCSECGSVTHYCSLPESDSSRVAINGRIFDPVMLTGLNKREFDGEAM